MFLQKPGTRKLHLLSQLCHKTLHLTAYVSLRHSLIVLSFSSAAEAIMFSVGWQAQHRTTSTTHKTNVRNLNTHVSKSADRSYHFLTMWAVWQFTTKLTILTANSLSLIWHDRFRTWATNYGEYCFIKFPHLYCYDTDGKSVLKSAHSNAQSSTLSLYCQLHFVTTFR